MISALLTTTSKPKMVSSRFLISQLAALVTNSRSIVAFELLPTPELRFPLAVGKDFKLRRKDHHVMGH